MKPKDPRLRVGITLTFFAGLLFTLVFCLGSTLSWMQGTSELVVTFRDVQGVRKNDPVQFHGVPCGRVVAVNFQQDSDHTRSQVALAGGPMEPAANDTEGVEVALTLQIPNEIHDFLREGSVATIQKTLTGVTVISLRQGSGAPLDRGVVIPGRKTITVDQVTSQLHRAAERLTEIFDDVQPLVSDIRERRLVSSALESLQTATEEARKLATELRDVTSDNRESVRRATQHAAGLFEELEAASPEVASTIAEVKRAAGQATDLTSELRILVQDNRARIDATTEDIAGAAKNMRTLSAELRHRPWRLLHSPSKEEAQELDLYESATAFGNGLRDMRRTIEQIERVLTNEVDDPTVAARLQGALNQMEAHISRHQAFEEAFWKRLQGIKK
ncbi:MAG: MlaD family protein [Planctomycetota bacterium]